jgi:hypothetical protein
VRFECLARALSPGTTLLVNHRGVEVGFGRDEVVVVVATEVDVRPVDGASEAASQRGVPPRRRHRGVEPDIESFVEGEVQRVGSLHVTVTIRPAVDVERDGAALTDASAGVGELASNANVP